MTQKHFNLSPTLDQRFLELSVNDWQIARVNLIRDIHISKV
jgi:hypothetical protein